MEKRRPAALNRVQLIYLHPEAWASKQSGQLGSFS